MSTANKLTYLNTTKTMLRDSLNKFGSNILTNDTFRSYDTKLNEIYDKLPKVTQSGAGFTLENVQNGQVDDFKMIGTDLYQNQLPSEYTAVEYLQSDNECYIDTGINADYKLSLKIKTACLNSTQQHMGAINNTGSSYIRHHITFNPSQPQDIGIYIGQTNNQLSLKSFDNNFHEFNLDIYNKKVSIDNDSPISISYNNFDVGINYYLFARNGSSIAISKGSYKIAYCKMYYENNLVRDFAPCYRNSDNVAGLYDFVTNTFFTNQGTGTFTVGNTITLPNPDYPQEIKVVEGRQVVTDKGKNLFDVSQTPHSNSLPGAGVITTLNNDGTISTSGTNTETYRNIRYDIQLPAGEYIISGCPAGGSKNGYSSLVQLTEETSSQIFDTGSGATFTLTETTTVKFYPVRVGSETVNFNGLIFKPMIRLSNISNDTFESYYEPVSYNIDLQLANIYLAKMPNTDYKNRIYKNNGNWYYEEKVKKVVLDGSENITLQNTVNNIIGVRLPIGNNVKPNTRVYCSHLKDTTFSKYYDRRTYGMIASHSSLITTNLFASAPNESIITIDQYKNWLSTKNTTVYCILDNPITTQITNTTLINQLEAISVHTGTNIITISNDNNIIPEIEITRLKELEKLA